MSGIAKASDKMKKKLSFGDYTQVEIPPKTVARKIYSLSKEDGQKLHAIFTKRLENLNPTSIADIMSEAIQLLYAREL